MFSYHFLYNYMLLKSYIWKGCDSVVERIEVVILDDALKEYFEAVLKFALLGSLRSWWGL